MHQGRKACLTALAAWTTCFLGSRAEAKPLNYNSPSLPLMPCSVGCQSSLTSKSSHKLSKQRYWLGTLWLPPPSSWLISGGFSSWVRVIIASLTLFSWTSWCLYLLTLLSLLEYSGCYGHVFPSIPTPLVSLCLLPLWSTVIVLFFLPSSHGYCC